MADDGAGNPMRDDARGADAASGRDGLAAQLRELEAFIARSDASGEPPFPGAVEMVERLREILTALDGLTSSLEE